MSEMTKREKGWLQKQIKAAQKSIASCPAWMRRAMRFEGSRR